MSWIDKIRSKPQEQKIRLIWIIVIVTAVLLVALWIILSRYEKHLPMDTSIFQTIGKGIREVKDNYKK